MNFKKIINLLTDNNLIDTNNKAMIDKLEFYPNTHVFMGDSPYANCETLLKALYYIDHIKLLDKTTLDRCLEIATTPGKPAHSIEAAPLFDVEIFLLLSSLEKHNININQGQLNTILHLKKRAAQRLLNLLDDFHKANLLSKDTFSDIMARIVEQGPKITESTFDKVRKGDTQTRSCVKLDNKITIYPDEMKEKMRGGKGIVKKAYDSPSSSTPAFMLKKIEAEHAETDKKDAKREAKHNKFFGQAYFFYKNNKARVVSEWRQGKPLDRLRLKELTDITYEDRLCCVASGLFYLNELHRRYRVHGDVSSANFIIDFENKKMHLIDFGSAHKIGSGRIFPHNRDYDEPMERRKISADKETHSQAFFAELYAMGIVTAEIFPELFSITWAKAGQGTVIVLKKTENLHPLEKAIVHLATALTNPDRTKSCNAEDALHFCQKLIGCFSTLDDNQIDIFRAETIARTTTSFEDVFRGIIRSPNKSK